MDQSFQKEIREHYGVVDLSDKSPSEILDAYLQKFEEFKDKSYTLSITDFHNTFSITETVMILDKLMEDKFVTRNGINYQLTFSGRFFIGYAETDVAKNAENIRLETLAAYQREQGDRLNRLTFWISAATITAAVAGLIAAFYYLTELWKFFC